MLYSRILLCNLIAVCVVVCAPLVHTHTHSHIYTRNQVHKRILLRTQKRVNSHTRQYKRTSHIHKAFTLLQIHTRTYTRSLIKTHTDIHTYKQIIEHIHTSNFQEHNDDSMHNSSTYIHIHIVYNKFL